MNGNEGGLSIFQYNDALRSPMVLAILRHFARQNLQFSSFELINHLCSVDTFPLFTARALLAAAEAAGVELTGEKVDLSDLASSTTPFLTYVEDNDAESDLVQLMEILEVGDHGALVASSAAGTTRITRKKLRDMWTGIVFTAQNRDVKAGSTEIDKYRSKMRVLPAFLPPIVCDNIISYCEGQIFRRSRVFKQSAGGDVTDSISLKARNSTSALLNDRSHPEIADIYHRIGELEGVDPGIIEPIQCVRYKPGQRFSCHFDSANGIERRTTYLLYLNDDFKGGQTQFPMLGHDVQPRAGDCLQFPSCDETGRIFWQSEHIGSAVTAGIKYALNIWVRRHISS